MRNRIITAVKQRFSIRKLSIGAASVLLGTSLYFMGGSATIVHADTNVSGTETSKAAVPEQKAPAKDKIDKNKLYDIATNKNNDDTTVNDAIDKYAQVKQEEVGDNALIRASDKEPTTIATTASQRGKQVDTIAKKLDQAVKNANQEAQKINDYKNAHPNTVSGEGAQHFADQGLSIDDEPDSEINQITVDHNNKDKGNTLSKGQSETIDGIHITHTDKMTDKEQNVMKINSDNKVIVDFQHNQCSGKEITVTYDDLKNSYYLENINNKTNKIKISKIERTFSHIQEADKIRFTSDGHTPKGADGAYDECYGPQLIIYNDPSDGFFYNNITQVSVKDIYYDDQGSQINFDTKNDNNKAWIFVTSLNSNGGGNVEKVSAQGPNNSSVDVEKIAGSTVTNHNGLWYSDNNNNFGGNPDWDNRDEANRFGFVGTVAVQYHPGMTLQYSVEDWQWGSHWACTQTQVVSSLDTPVIIYDHIKDGAVPVTPQTPPTVIPKKPDGSQAVDPKNLTKEVDLTVDYVNSDGTKFNGDAPKNHNQQVTFTGTAYVDKITGELVNAKQVDGTWVVDDSKTDKPQVIWTVKDGKDSFDEVISPIERGYHLTKISSHRKGNNVRAITGLTKDSGSITVTVTYTKNGKIIPIDKNDNPITGADQPVFPTDPTDPTKVDSGNIPDLSDKGYHPLDKNVKPGDPVDPDSEDPSKDITVKYVKSGTISVKYHDNTEDKDINGYGKNASGDEDDPFNYDPATDLAKLAGKGYVLDGKVPEIPAKFTDGAQEVIINLKHGTTTVTSNNPGKPGEPVDPKNPEGPKYPNGTELDQVKRTGTQTIHYVGAGDKTPADNKQTFVFTRKITFDDVTGKIISVTPWNVQSHTFGNVDTPVIPGYHADKAVAGGETVTPDDLNKVITVTYAPDGGSGDNPGSNGGGDQGTTPTPEPTPDDQPDTKLPSDNNTDKDVEKDKQDKPEKVKKARKIIKTRITKQEHIGNAEKSEPLAEQEHNDQTVASPVKNEANEPQLPQTGEANTSVIGLLGMLVAGFAAILGFESSRSRKHKN